MNWNKVNLKSKEKNLLPIGESVLWATNKKQTMDGKFLKFIGYLSEDRTIDILNVDEIRILMVSKISKSLVNSAFW